MYAIYHGNHFVTVVEGYRAAVAYCQRHAGCRMVYTGD